MLSIFRASLAQQRLLWKSNGSTILSFVKTFIIVFLYQISEGLQSLLTRGNNFLVVSSSNSSRVALLRITLLQLFQYWKQLANPPLTSTYSCFKFVKSMILWKIISSPSNWVKSQIQSCPQSQPFQSFHKEKLLAGYVLYFYELTGLNFFKVACKNGHASYPLKFLEVIIICTVTFSYV